MYRIKNWDTFQHYKDRNPPWIRLYRHLLDDFEFHSLPVASRALAPMLWLLAAENPDPSSGIVQGGPDRIAFRLRMEPKELDRAIKPLISSGFVEIYQSDSKPLSSCSHDATPETEAETYREEAEREGRRASVEATTKPPPRKGTRLSPEWDLPEAWGEWAEQQGMTREQIIRECDKFKDYWISKAGSNATKADWEATWRNWIRKHLEEYAR